jgi:hypothetical protein
MMMGFLERSKIFLFSHFLFGYVFAFILYYLGQSSLEEVPHLFSCKMREFY